MVCFIEFLNTFVNLYLFTFQNIKFEIFLVDIFPQKSFQDSGLSLEEGNDVLDTKTSNWILKQWKIL